MVGIGAGRDTIEPAAENVSASVKVEVKGGGRERRRGRRRAGLKDLLGSIRGSSSEKLRSHIKRIFKKAGRTRHLPKLWYRYAVLFYSLQSLSCVSNFFFRKFGENSRTAIPRCYAGYAAF